MGFTHNEVRAITVDPQVIDRVRFGHQQEVHTSLHHRPTLQTSVFGLGSGPLHRQAHPSQASVAHMMNSDFDSIQDTPAIPPNEGSVLDEPERPLFDLLSSTSKGYSPRPYYEF